MKHAIGIAILGIWLSIQAGFAQTADKAVSNYELENVTLDNCPQLRQLSDSAVRAFVLGQQKAPADLTCYAAAIVRLGLDRTSADTDALVEILDYRFPDQPQDEGFQVEHLSTPESRYPAIKALVSIGRPAIPVLLNAAQNGSLSETTQENAIVSLKKIHEGRVLPQCAAEYSNIADHAIKTPSARGELADAFHQADRHCEGVMTARGMVPEP